MAEKKTEFIVGWLLLGAVACAGVGASRDNAPVPADKCSNGVTVGKAFSDCLWELAFGSRDVSRVFFGASTVRDIRSLLPTFCGTVMPAARRCFSGGIVNCESGQQQQLRELAEDAGYFCLPHSNLTHPAVSSVLDSFSEADLDATEDCAGEEDPTKWTDCDDEAKQNVMGHLDRSAMLALSVQELTLVLKKYYKVLMQCTARETARSSASCSRQWRGVALKRLSLVLQPWASLGIPLPFTQQEFTALFQLEREGQPSAQ